MGKLTVATSLLMLRTCGHAVMREAAAPSYRDTSHEVRIAGISALIAVALTLACGREPPAPADASLQKRVTFSILEDYDKGESLEQVARDFDLFAELGVKTWRGSFGWDDYEPSPGAYDFQWLHRFATLAASRGITLRPYIGYTPMWASAGGSDSDVWNDPPEDLDAWQRFVRALTHELRRHRNVASYEIYNEENVRQWWDGTPSRYAEVLRGAAAAVEDGNPDAQLLLGGMVFPDSEWIDAVCGNGGSGRQVDVVPFHAYPETWTPPGVTVETYLGQDFVSNFVETVDATCGRRPLWINETGYATTPGRTEADQANWWVRAVATFAATPRIEHIGIYEIKDLPRDRAVIGDAPYYHLGLTYADRRKKIAFGTVARLVAMFGQEPFVASRPRIAVTGTSTSAPVHGHLFVRGDGRRLLFLWTRTGAATVDVNVGARDDDAIEYRLDGRPGGTVPVDDGWLRALPLRAGGVRFFEVAR
jgi:hypothetical protein